MHSSLKLSARRNETETKQFQHSSETVLKQFRNSFVFSFVSMCGQLHYDLVTTEVVSSESSNIVEIKATAERIDST